MCKIKTFKPELVSVNVMATNHSVDSLTVARLQQAVTDPDLAEKCAACADVCNLRFSAEVIGVATRVAPILARSNGSRLFNQ